MLSHGILWELHKKAPVEASSNVPKMKRRKSTNEQNGRKREKTRDCHILN